jgi:predicted  nucleic acid-binding Zn-ribbon protein
MPNATSIENRLRKLESRYRHALSAAVAAKARYLALHGESSSTAAAVARAKTEWHTLESQRAQFAAQMRELEELEHESVT